MQILILQPGSEWSDSQRCILIFKFQIYIYELSLKGLWSTTIKHTLNFVRLPLAINKDSSSIEILFLAGILSRILDPITASEINQGVIIIFRYILVIAIQKDYKSMWPLCCYVLTLSRILQHTMTGLSSDGSLILWDPTTSYPLSWHKLQKRRTVFLR